MSIEAVFASIRVRDSDPLGRRRGFDVRKLACDFIIMSVEMKFSNK
jgi:hypothetical protein